MTKRDYLRILEKQNLLSVGVKLGVISPTSIIYAEMFDEWFSLCAKGKKSLYAAIDVGNAFGVSQQTIWNAIRDMREPI